MQADGTVKEKKKSARSILTVAKLKKNQRGLTLGVQFETGKGRGDGRKDRQSVDSGLDVGSSSLLIGQHLCDTRDLITRRDNQRDHGGSITMHRKGARVRIEQQLARGQAESRPADSTMVLLARTRRLTRERLQDP